MITIVGLGALGSHVALFLRNEKLRVVDFDRVEQKNTLAQFHGVQSLRRNKAQSIVQILGSLFKVKVEARPTKLIVDNVGAMLGGSALVIDCCDNLEARSTIQRYCRDNNVPCLHSCLSADGGFGRVVWTDDFTPDPEGDVGQATCEDGEQLPFFGMVAVMTAATAQIFLRKGRRQSYELAAGSLVRIA